MYLDEFCVALPFIKKSFYDSGRDAIRYILLNEIFKELLMKKLPMEDRVLFNAQCLYPLKRTRKFGSDCAARLLEDVVNGIGEHKKAVRY